MEMKINPVYRAILDEAHAAGAEAAEKCTPTPVGWRSVDIFDKPLPGSKTEVSNDGLCGFAWVHIKGNTAFGRWAKKAREATAGYPSGLVIRPKLMTQSIERKEAYVKAAAEVLKRHGIDCHTSSRLD